MEASTRPISETEFFACKPTDHWTFTEFYGLNRALASRAFQNNAETPCVA